jgi:hypothetical protein
MYYHLPRTGLSTTAADWNKYYIHQIMGAIKTWIVFSITPLQILINLLTMVFVTIFTRERSSKGLLFTLLFFLLLG